MSLTGSRTFVGFGFGAIQSGLFLYEAFKSGNFGHLLVAEVMPDVVDALRSAGGRFACNIAHADHIERVQIGPIQIENPARVQDRVRLVQAIAQADEISTAIPSVDFYVSEGEASLHHILAAGLVQKVSQQGPPAVVYTAENNNHAAEILQAAVLDALPAAARDRVQSKVRFLNTVIGKMSGVVSDPAQISAQSLAPSTPGSKRAFLVEAFNKILISRIRFDKHTAFERGITVFQEKTNLLPFEEAKLYGHNATHALAAYIGLAMKNSDFSYIADLQSRPDIVALVRAAFIEESGAALIKKYAGLDPLFTPAGYMAYADDLLARMMNPFLRDTMQRVGRAPERKLGWDDRLVGTMRMALAQGISPLRYALGAAAALAALVDDEPAVENRLRSLWRGSSPHPDESQVVLELITAAYQQLRCWRKKNFSGLPK